MSDPSADALSAEELAEVMRQISSMEDADAESDRLERDRARAEREQRHRDDEERQLQEAIRLSQMEAAFTASPTPPHGKRNQAGAAATPPAAAPAPAAVSTPAAAASFKSAAATFAAPAAIPTSIARRASMPTSAAAPAAAASQQPRAHKPVPARRSVPPLPPSSLTALSPPSPAAPAASYPAAAAPAAAVPVAVASHAPKRVRSPRGSAAARPAMSRAATMPVARAHFKRPPVDSEVDDNAAIEYSPLVELRRLYPRYPFQQQPLTQWFKQHSFAASAPSSSAAGPSFSAAAAATAAAAALLPSPRNYVVHSETELCGFVQSLHALLVRSPGTVLPAEVVRAVWCNMLAEEISVHTANGRTALLSNKRSASMFPESTAHIWLLICRLLLLRCVNARWQPCTSRCCRC